MSRTRLADGVRRMTKSTWVTRDGITQIFNRWRPIRLPISLNHSDSDSASGGHFESDINEDEVDISLGTEALGFDWVEIDDDARNYALYVNSEFYKHAVVMETTLNQHIATVETDILRALEGQRLHASPAVTGTITTVFVQLRVELAGLFRDHCTLFR